MLHCGDCKSISVMAGSNILESHEGKSAKKIPRKCVERLLVCMMTMPWR